MNLMPAIVMMTSSRCLECNITIFCHGLFSLDSHVCATLNEECSLVQCLSDALGEPFWSLNAAGCSNRICWWLCPAHVQLILKDCLRFSTHDNTCERSCVQSTSMAIAAHVKALAVVNRMKMTKVRWCYLPGHRGEGSTPLAALQ